MSNPVFDHARRTMDNEVVVNADDIMTVNGTIQVTAFMGVLLVCAAYFSWRQYALGYTDMASMLTFGGGIVGFILALIICFTKKTFLIPIYSAAEGLFLGGISALFESEYPGIVIQAVMGTFAALFSMLALYRLGIIRCSEKFRSVIFISTASIAAIYVVDFIGRLFGHAVPIINTATPLGIVFTVVVVIIAALNLIVDFDFIEQGAQRMLPKTYEWYGAFGLMVTIVWLYLEILKLLAKTRRR